MQARLQEQRQRLQERLEQMRLRLPSPRGHVR